MNNIARDLQYASRTLLRSPCLSILAVSALAIGIAAVTAAFAFARGILFSPLPYADPDRLVTYYLSDRDRVAAVSFPDYEYWKREGADFEAAAGYRVESRVTWQDGETAHRVEVADVTGNFGQVLQLTTQRGRLIGPEEEDPGSEAAVVVSDLFWRGRLGASSDVIGSALELNGSFWTIVGVLSPGLGFPGRPDVHLYRPFLRAHPERRLAPGYPVLNVIARLAPRVGTAQATQYTAQLGRALAQERIRPTLRQSFRAVPLLESILGDIEVPIAAFSLLVVLLLLIACANAGGLLLVHNDDRRVEYAVRLALGASRWANLRLPILQAACLSMASGAAALLASNWIVGGIKSLLPHSVPRLVEVAIDGTTLGVVAAAASLATVAAGVLPALRCRSIHLTDSFKLTGADAPEGPKSGFGRKLLTGQVALTAVLLVLGLLSAKSLLQARGIDHGFRLENLLTFQVSLRDTSHGEHVEEFVGAALKRLEGLPGVDGAGAAVCLPLTGFPVQRGIQVEGVPTPKRGFHWIDLNYVSPGYFGLMGSSLLTGREFEWSLDTRASPRTAIVSETFVRRFWPGLDPVGRRLKLGPEDSDDPWVTVVGVVGDLRYHRLGAERRPPFQKLENGLQVYMPLTQDSLPMISFVVHGRGDVNAQTEPVRTLFKSIDSTLPLNLLKSMDSVVDEFEEGPRRVAGLLFPLALSTLALSALGIYGLANASLQRRSREIALRLALGAGPTEIFRQSTISAFTAVLPGLGLGLLATAMLSQAFAALLIDVQTLDVQGYVGAVLIVSLATLLSLWGPVRGMLRPDLMHKLKN